MGTLESRHYQVSERHLNLNGTCAGYTLAAWHHERALAAAAIAMPEMVLQSSNFRFYLPGQLGNEIWVAPSLGSEKTIEVVSQHGEQDLVTSVHQFMSPSFQSAAPEAELSYQIRVPTHPRLWRKKNKKPSHGTCSLTDRSMLDVIVELCDRAAGREACWSLPFLTENFFVTRSLSVQFWPTTERIAHLDVRVNSEEGDKAHQRKALIQICGAPKGGTATTQLAFAEVTMTCLNQAREHQPLGNSRFQRWVVPLVRRFL